jgi:hypothetical protein
MLILQALSFSLRVQLFAPCNDFSMIDQAKLINPEHWGYDIATIDRAAIQPA